MVGSVTEARAAAAAGVDAVILQGVEAGGHVRGTTSIWELLPATVAALGTRFVASDEAWIHPAYKQRVVECDATDTVYTELYDAWWPGAPHRALRNKTFQDWEAAGRPSPGQRPGEGTLIGRRLFARGS